MSFAATDEMRRWYGRALDLWLARTEAPSRVVLERSGVKLRDYAEEGNRPALLIIPAPIKKSYIWDLTPSASAVRPQRPFAKSQPIPAPFSTR
jgi:polyhydroxyalkanoate synthase subunit PhaC